MTEPADQIIISGPEIVILVLTGLLLFVLSVAVRAKTGGKYAVKLIDIGILLVPFFVWLVAKGRIEGISVGDVEIKTAKVFLVASETPIESQVKLTSALTIEDAVHTVERATKGGTDRIPSLIESKTEALEFRLLHGGYWGPAIEEYFESLAAAAFLRYAIIYDEGGRLFGIYDARELVRYFRQKGRSAYDDFASWLNAGDDRSLERLSDLPGFIPGEHAVTIDSNKRNVLEEMENLKTESLPVVDSERRFVGMVERSRLIASLILEVTDKLEHLK